MRRSGPPPPPGGGRRRAPRRQAIPWASRPRSLRPRRPPRPAVAATAPGCRGPGPARNRHWVSGAGRAPRSRNPIAVSARPETAIRALQTAIEASVPGAGRVRKRCAQARPGPAARLRFLRRGGPEAVRGAGRAARARQGGDARDPSETRCGIRVKHSARTKLNIVRDPSETQCEIQVKHSARFKRNTVRDPSETHCAADRKTTGHGRLGVGSPPFDAQRPSCSCQD